MTWEEVNKDLDAYQAALTAQTSSGVDRRVAEGRARRAGIRAYLKAHPEEEAAHAARGPRRGARRRRRGGSAPQRPPRRRPRRRPVAPCAVGRGADDRAVREAPLPTGNIPSPEEGRARQAPLARDRAARGHPARRARTGRPRAHVAAPAARRVHRHGDPVRRAARLLVADQRAAARARQPEPHAEPVEGPVVLPRPAGAAALLPPDGGRAS